MYFQNRQLAGGVRSDVGYTHSNAVAEAGARLRTSSTDVVPHGRFLTSRAVQIGYGPRTVGTREGSRSSGVSA